MELKPLYAICGNVNQHKCFDIGNTEKNLFGIEKLNIPRSEIPAITHVDFSARVQTVHSETNELYHCLINHFKRLVALFCKYPFNVRGEPLFAHRRMHLNVLWGLD